MPGLIYVFIEFWLVGFVFRQVGSTLPELNSDLKSSQPHLLEVQPSCLHLLSSEARNLNPVPCLIFELCIVWYLPVLAKMFPPDQPMNKPVGHFLNY